MNSPFSAGEIISRYNYPTEVIFMKYSDTNDISEKLRKLREANALSQRQVADALHVERSTYTKYETGDSEPSLTTLVKIAKILNVPPVTLLPGGSCEQNDTDTLSDSAFVDYPIYQLTREERTLIAYFRVLSKGRKQEALETMANFTKNDVDSEEKIEQNQESVS